MPELAGKIGPYELLRRLGAGGMGEVFLAYDERLDRQVAIKRIRSDKSATSERRERFRREARVAARLNHPAIVQVYDVLAEGDVDSIVMEAVEGTDLRTLIGGRPLPLEAAVVIARDVADGLAEAHRQGIVHRDLKSENVLVTPAGRAKITDFGIAKRLLAGKTEDSLTAIGHVMGTYRAMSPEQARGEEVDHRSDLFSFGILLYEMLTGKIPLRGRERAGDAEPDRPRPADARAGGQSGGARGALPAGGPPAGEGSNAAAAQRRGARAGAGADGDRDGDRHGNPPLVAPGDGDRARLAAGERRTLVRQPLV